MRVRGYCAAVGVLVACAGVIASGAQASQTTRRPAACNVKPAATVNDERVVELGTDFQPARRSGEKMQVGGTVTDVVWVMNHTDCPITLSKHDWKGLLGTAGEVIEVPPRGSYEGHMWVPWRDSPTGESMWLYIRGRPYFSMWQMAGRIAFRSYASIDRAIASGWDNYRAGYGRSPNVPGMAMEGGPRILHVATTKEGEPFFKFEGVPQE